MEDLAQRLEAVQPEEGPELLLYPQDRAGYGRLSTLLTVGRRLAPKGSYQLRLPDVLDHSDGLLAICIQHTIAPLDGKLFVDYLSTLKRERLKKKAVKKAKRGSEDGESSRLSVPVI